MAEPPPTRVAPVWRSDIPGMVGCLLVAVVPVLAGALLSLLLNGLRQHAWPFCGVAVALGLCGIVLLFRARLPLYRQRRFFAVGARHLDAPHRRLYRWAYVCLVMSAVVLLLLWLQGE